MDVDPWRGLEQGHDPLDEIWRVPAVVVGKGEDRAAALREADIARPRQAARGAAMMDPQARREGGQYRLEHARRILVDDDDLEIGLRLGDERGEEARQGLRAADRAKDQRHRRRRPRLAP
jgi:hypothetical protein